MIHLALIALAALNGPAADPVALADPTSFIRFVKSKTTSRLETACVTYENLDDGSTITLVGAVHIGDKSYYEELQRILSREEVVLFEGIKGDPAERDALMTLVGRLQNLLRDYLGLTHQRDAIDYGRENFVHADMTAKELSKRLAAEDIELIPNAELLRTLGPLVETTLKLLSTKEGEAPSRFALGMQRRLKLLVGRTLGDGLEVYERFKRPQDRVRDEIIIGARNELVFEELVRRLEGGAKSVAVFYGAAHHADFDKRIRSRWNVTEKSVVWVPAWTIKTLSSRAKPEKPKKPANDHVKKL